MSPERSKKHHWVPQLSLRRFANENEQVATVDLSTGRSFIQSIQDAAATNNYNEIVEDDGSKSDWIEGYLAELEGHSARAIRLLLEDGRVNPDTDERFWLAFYLLLQHTRTPRARRLHDELADQSFKLQIAAEGPKRLREILAEIGVDSSAEAVLEQWNLITEFGWSLNLSTNDHVRHELEIANEMAPAIASMHWNVIRFNRKRLLTSDHPVGLMPHRGTPPWMGTGLFTAEYISLPLSRSTALLVQPLLPDDPRIPEEQPLVPTARFANHLNQLTTHAADRWVYHHPDDDPTGGLDLRYDPHRLVTSGLTPEVLAASQSLPAAS